MRYFALSLVLATIGCAASAPAFKQFHDDPAKIADAVELACALEPSLPRDECEVLPAAIRVAVEAGADASDYVKRAKALLREVE
jgi:hypothetical protein